MSNNNDFMYALREDLPENFSDSLRDQLKQLEQDAPITVLEPSTPTAGRQNNTMRWLLAVASLAVIFAGVLLLVLPEPLDDVGMNIATIPPSLTNYGELEPETVAQLELVTTLSNGTAQQLTLSDDGDTLVVTGARALYLHDASDIHAPARTIPLSQYANVMQVTDDDLIYAVSSNWDSMQSSFIRVDGTTGEVDTFIDLESPFLYHYHLSLEGNRLAIVACIPDDELPRCMSESYQIHVYDVTTGELGISIPLTNVDGNNFYSVPMAMSEDGQYLAYSILNADNDVELIQVDLTTGASELLIIRDAPIEYSWIRYTADNEFLLIHSNNRISQYPLAFLMSASSPVEFDDDTITERTKGQFLRSMPNEVLLHPDGQTIVAAGSSSIYMYDTVTSETTYHQTDFQLNQAFNSWVLTPDGNHFFGLNGSGTITRYSFPDVAVEDVLYHYDGYVPYLIRFRDNATLYTSSGYPYGGAILRQWDLSTDDPSSSLFTGNSTEPINITGHFAISPDGRFMYYEEQHNRVVYQDPTKWILDLETGASYDVDNIYTSQYVTFVDDTTLLGISGGSGYLYDVTGRLGDGQENSEDVTYFPMRSQYVSQSWWSIGDTTNVASGAWEGQLMATLPCLAPEVRDDVNERCQGLVTIWDVNTGQPLYQLHDEAWLSAINISLDADSQTLFIPACNTDDAIDWYDCEDLFIYDLSAIEYDADAEGVPIIEVDAVAHMDNFTHEVHRIVVQPSPATDETLIAVSGRSLTTFVSVDDDYAVEQQATFTMNNVTFSPNGDLVLGSNAMGQIEVWAVAPPRSQSDDDDTASTVTDLRLSERTAITGDTFSQTEVIAEYGQGVAMRLALSKDDETLAIGTDLGVYLHDADDLSAEATFLGRPTQNMNYYLEFDDVGTLYMTTIDTIEDEISVFEYTQAEWMRIYRQPLAPWSSATLYDVVQSVDISPDGERMLLGTCRNEGGYVIQNGRGFCTDNGNASLHLIDFANPDANEAIELNEVANAIATMSDDWSHLAYLNDGHIYLRDMATGETKPVIGFPTNRNNVNMVFPSNEVFELHFSPDGEQLGIVQNTSGIFSIWSVDNLSVVAPQVIDTLEASRIAVHPRTNARLIGHEDEIIVRDTEGTTLDEFEFVHNPHEILFTRNGDTVYVLNRTAVVQAFDWQTRQQIDMTDAYTIREDMAMAISDDGSLMVSYSASYTTGVSYLWEITDDGISQQALLPVEQVAEPIQAATISPDKRYVAYAQGLYIHVYDREMDEHRQLDLVFKTVDLAFRDDGTLVALVMENNRGVRKHYTPEMLASGDVPYPHEGQRITKMVTISADSSYISKFHNVVLSPDGETIVVRQCGTYMPANLDATCDEQSFHFVDVETGELLSVFSPLEDDTSFTSMTFSQDGDYVALAFCKQMTIQGWDCEDDGGEVAIFSIEEVRSGEVSNVVILTGINTWNNTLGLHVQADESFIVSMTRWEPIAERMSDLFTRVWSLAADGTSEELYYEQVASVEIAPTGYYLLELGDSLKMRMLPIR